MRAERENDVEITMLDDTDFGIHKNNIKQDCNICENRNTKWCGGCDYNYRHPNNFDFYRPTKH